MSWPRILVTGAGGFIGGAIAKALHDAGATNLRAGVTRLPGAARLAQASLDIVPCDMFDAEALGAAMKGVDVVIHCAWTGDAARSVEGGRRVLQQAKAAGVGKVIQMSSVAVYGDAQGPVAEDTRPIGRLSAYGRAKRACEADGRQMASPGMNVCIVRPALVYGPHSDLWTLPYIRRLASGRWRRLGPAGEGRANLIHVNDLAEFAGFLATHDVGEFGLFNANGPDVPTWNAYLDLFGDALGVARPTGRQATSLIGAALRRPLKVLERRLLKMRPGLAGRPGPLGSLFKAMQDDVAMAPSYQELALYRLKAVYSIDAAAAIGFRPRTGLSQGLADCATWARESGLL